MDWIKTSIETTGAGIEVITGALLACDITSIEIIDSEERARFFADSGGRTWDYADESLLVSETDCAYIVFYVTNDIAGKKILNKVTQALSPLSTIPGIGTLTLRQESANDETWLNEWKKHFKPIRLGRIVIVPEWESFTKENESDIIFKIDPGTAFGTGQHQTTQLCINAVQKWVNPGDRVLDIGCGSGILSIISLLLGADFVYAIDIDPAGAISATKRNTALNPVNPSTIKIAAGDVLTDEKARADIGNTHNVVVANIVADVIIPLVPLVSSFMQSGGLFIASGIISDRLDDVLAVFTTQGLTVLAQEEIEGWHCLVGKINA